MYDYVLLCMIDINPLTESIWVYLALLDSIWHSAWLYFILFNHAWPRLTVFDSVFDLFLII